MWGCVSQCFHLPPFCWGLLSGERTQWPCSGKLRLGFLLTEATEHHWDCALKTAVVLATQPLRQGDARGPGSAGAPRGRSLAGRREAGLGRVLGLSAVCAALPPWELVRRGRDPSSAPPYFLRCLSSHLLWSPGRTWWAHTWTPEIKPGFSASQSPVCDQNKVLAYVLSRPALTWLCTVVALYWKWKNYQKLLIGARTKDDPEVDSPRT